MRGRVRYDRDPVGLSDALVAGSEGKTLRYIPDLADPDVDFQCDLVAPLAPFGLELDQQRGILGDQSQWNKITGGTEETMTPQAGQKILWQATETP